MAGARGCSRQTGETNVKKSGTILIGAAMLCMIALYVPAVSAADSGQSWNNNPEHITAMKAYVAYVSEDYQAMMNGAISYIGTISGSAGTGDLTGAEQQFTATAGSVQSMTTNDSIDAALTQMKGEVSTFHTDTANDLKAYNGSESALRASVNASITADQATIESLDTAWWTARETSRLDEFTHNDAIRNGALTNLSAKGIDVSQPQGIETQIGGLQGSLKSALDARDEKALAGVNTQLGTLGTQFWEAIAGDAWQARETTRLAEFDNRTTILQNQLTNMTARGIDVTQAQAILSQITAERDPLKAAFDNHDQQALKTVDTQLTALYQQFRTTVQGYRQAAVSRARENAGNMTRNASFRQGAFRGAATPAMTGGNTS
ncbi:hypothetical protein [Methanoregula sp.]|uniref:hypothetical protein n=1 Tax=Methanoregula sp. TaxID=2052170 RepID=UPI003C7260D7